MTAKYDIVVPTFGCEDFTVRCLESIRANTEDYRIVWVDNGSFGASRSIVMDEIVRHGSRLTIWLGKNTGFVGAVNAGLAQCTAPYVVLQNNDTEVTGGWLERLEAPFKADVRVMVSGPLTSACGSWQAWPNVRSKLYPSMPSLAGVPLAAVPDVLINHFGNAYREVKMVAFFSTLFRRSVFDRLGLLDEAFGAGLGDDDDMCHRIRSSGGKVAFVPSAYVLHHHRTTFRTVYGEEETLRMQERNMDILRGRGIS